jgi:hypothetical protein
MLGLFLDCANVLTVLRNTFRDAHNQGNLGGDGLLDTGSSQRGTEV